MEYNLEDLLSFVGKSKEYYEKVWTKNKLLSWNWASFLFNFFWLIYRKMYLEFIIFFVSYRIYYTLTYSLISSNIKFIIDIFIIFLFGIFGNKIYFFSILRKLKKMKKSSLEKEYFIKKYGGTNNIILVLLIGIFFFSYLLFFLDYNKQHQRIKKVFQEQGMILLEK